MDFIRKYFEFERHGTGFKKEILGGATTFITMAYIIIVNPKILQAAGLPFEASMAATIWSSFIGTLLMGIYARRPFAVAPYMGENAFIAFTVVKVLGYTWQAALGAIFLSGILFTVLTVLNIRSWLAKAIPQSLRIAFSAGIGLFLVFIGLNEIGFIVPGVPGAPVHIGALKSTTVLLGIFGVLLTVLLIIKRVRGAILISILATTSIGLLIGSTLLPTSVFSLPPDLAPVFLQLDIAGALSWKFFAIILVVFVMDFVDTMGTLLGLSLKANLLDESGELPEIEKPMLCDALATTAGALLGTTTTGAYIESAAGIEAGARTGFASVITAFLFLAALFFAPVLTIIPAYAYGGALIVVGYMMVTSISHLPFNDFGDTFVLLTTVCLMSFSYNLGIGMTSGFLLFPLVRGFQGRLREINSGMWLLFFFSVLFYLFYPY